MAPPPSVSDFTSFHDFAPSSDHKCIFYIPEQGSTCRLPRSEADKARACEIHSDIVNGAGQSPDVALLEEYARRNMCGKPLRFFKGHQKDVQDTQPSLIKDLAARWLRELRAAKGEVTVEGDITRVEEAPPTPTPNARLASPASPATASRIAKTQTPRSKIPTPSAAVDPTVLKFVPFHDIDPVNQGTCIYMAKADKRCTWACIDEDNAAACLLHRQFSSSDDLPEIGLLMDFAKYNCCRSGSLGAGHQSRLEYGKLRRLLAERWLGEIRQQRERATTPTPVQRGRLLRKSVTPDKRPAVEGSEQAPNGGLEETSNDSITSEQGLNVKAQNVEGLEQEVDQASVATPSKGVTPNPGLIAEDLKVESSNAEGSSTEGSKATCSEVEGPEQQHDQVLEGALSKPDSTMDLQKESLAPAPAPVVSESVAVDEGVDPEASATTASAQEPSSGYADSQIPTSTTAPVPETLPESVDDQTSAPSTAPAPETQPDSTDNQTSTPSAALPQEKLLDSADNEISAPPAITTLEELPESADQSISAPSKPPKPARLRGKSIAGLGDLPSPVPVEIKSEKAPAPSITDDVPLVSPPVEKKRKPVVPPKSKLVASLPHSPPISPERSPTRGD